MAEDKKPPRATTELEMDKECKSSARFRTSDKEETVTTSLYLLNTAWIELGKPTKIKVTVTATE